jgi:hypothetical protein
MKFSSHDSSMKTQKTFFVNVHAIQKMRNIYSTTIEVDISGQYILYYG